MTSTGTVIYTDDYGRPVREFAGSTLALPGLVAALQGPVSWPPLGVVGLAPAMRACRLGGIGGSDANALLSGDAERVLSLWREKRRESESEDLSGVLPVMLGSWTEDFNRQWYARFTGYGVADCGSVWTCPVHPWRRATLDGIVEDKSSVFEAKHVSAFAKPDEVLARYMPQLQHNMAVTGLDNAVLSVIFGNHKWESYDVASDWLYQAELLETEQRFWICVQTGERPIAAAPIEPPKPVAYREVCFEGNNVWADAATDWIATADAAKRHTASVKALKEVIPDDVSRASGHGLEARRSKSGAISFRALAS